MKKSSKQMLLILLIGVIIAIVLFVALSINNQKKEAGLNCSPNTTSSEKSETESESEPSETAASQTTNNEVLTTETAETQETTRPSSSQTTETQLKVTETETPLAQVQSVCGTKYISKTTGRIVVDPNNENWNLIVVNSGREYVSSYTPELAEAVKGSGKYLDKRVAPFYQKMYDAAKKDGLTLTPYSAYRSYDRQKNNYENLTNSYMTQYSLSRADAAKKAATVILPPGTSEHNLGLAMDIKGTSNTFADTKEYAWLTEHAQDYGFILRYTAEKQPITGIVPEPWHWRFVGVENAKKIKASGLCLEEFLDSNNIDY